MISTGPFLDKENLVFGYDTGAGLPLNIRRGRYYAGRPTTNYVSYNNAVRQESYTDYSATSSGTWNAKHPHAIRAYNAQGTDITGYVNTGVTDWTNTYHAHWQYDDDLKKPVVVMDAFDGNWKAKSYDTNTTAWTDYGMSTGSKYVISWLQWTNNVNKAVHVGVYCRNSSNSNNFWDGLSGGSTTSKNTKPYTWQRVYHVFTVSSSHSMTIDYNTIYMYGHSLGPNSVGTTIKIADVQIELDTDYPSSYLDTLSDSSTHSRSSTESLLDITGNTTIDVSNISFDSSGYPTFDGTNDVITTSFAAQTISNVTIEAIVYRNQATSRYESIIQNNTASDDALYVYPSGYLGFWPHGASSLAVPVGEYAYVAASYNGSGITYCVNGDFATNSGTSSDITDWDFLRIGGHGTSDSERWIGKIPVAKVYNRALNTREISRNYNSYKERFDL